MLDQLSPIEAIMWRVGQDATLRMTVGALMILDRPADRRKRSPSASPPPPSRRRGCAGAPTTPTGHRGPARPGSTTTIPAPEHHLRSLSVASPGSMRQVLDLVGLLESIPFDPERSPWDVTLIEGLEGGRAALYLRAHHVLTDGVGGIRLLGLLLDEPGRATERPPPSRPAPASRRPTSRKRNGDRRPGTLTVTIDVPKAVRRFMDGVNVGP